MKCRGTSVTPNPIGNHARQFPEWNDLTAALADRLYPDEKKREEVLREAGATSAALRLAQEFEAAFRRTPLVDIVAEEIRDREFEPGSVHQSLLQLRWADVFTTNYDTLLERAAEGVWQQKYDLVRGEADLPIARRPRIVKLHGSLPTLRNLVLTEDDYRSYPRKHAPFVNAVQGALAENLFCLFGFSGNDPNFLAWTGWVRDELADSSPNVYLFATDTLKPFQRQLLEERRIIPIPIKEISGKESFHDAYRWLFDRLKVAPQPKRASWNIGPLYVIGDNDASVENEPFSPSRDKPKAWIDAALKWRQHRRQYRGWHVLYREGINRLWTHTRLWLNSLTQELAAIWSPSEAMLIFRELTWRCATALVPLPDDLVSGWLDPAIERYDKWRETKKDDDAIAVGEHGTQIGLSELDACRLRLCLELIRHAREIGDTKRLSRLLEKGDSLLRPPEFPETSDARSFIEHQRILLLLGNLDHEHARTRLEQWDTSTASPIWAVRRAGLCLECGLLDLGRNLTRQSLRSIRQNPVTYETDFQSLSTEGLARFLQWCLGRSARLDAPSKPGVPVESKLDSTRSSRQGLKEDKTEGARNGDLEGSSVDLTDTRERLNDLQRYGCDPNQLLDWLTLLNSDRMVELDDVTEKESFDVGRTSRSYQMGGNEQLRHAYRAIRFIEEAGLPLQIGRISGVQVAVGLYRDATRSIAENSTNEGIGLALRSCDEKLLDEFLSRKRVASMTVEQTRFLLAAGRSAMDQALTHLGPPPTPCKAEENWWESQFKIACMVLSRVATRLKDSEVIAILELIVDLPTDERIQGRLWAPQELATLVRCASESLSRAEIQQRIPQFMKTPVLGSDELPKELERTMGS